MMLAFADAAGVAFAEARKLFQFDGQTLPMSDTPRQHDMEDEDLIEYVGKRAAGANSSDRRQSPRTATTTTNNDSDNNNNNNNDNNDNDDNNTDNDNVRSSTRLRVKVRSKNGTEKLYTMREVGVSVSLSHHPLLSNPHTRTHRPTSWKR
jgi:hypothetical protein